jgi:hypothetical protein
MAAAASSSRTGLNRYPGLPPAYESESDSEGEDDYHEDDGDDDVDDDLETGGIEIQIQESAGCRLTRPPPAHLPDTGSTQISSSSIPSGSNASNQTSHSSPPQMEMIQRPVDMTSIIVLSTLPSTTATTPGTPPRPFAFDTYESGSSQEYTHLDPRHMTRSSISLPSITELPDTSK